MNGKEGTGKLDAAEIWNVIITAADNKTWGNLKRLDKKVWKVDKKKIQMNSQSNE